MDKVIVGIASIPSRINSLKTVISCLERQNNIRPIINCYLNGYERKPSFLNKSFINVFLSAEHAGDLGDAGKFYKVGEESGIYATCDDDIHYPPNYLETLIAGVKKHRCIVSFHGSILKSPVTSFYHNRKLISFKRTLLHDTNAHIAGTGCSSFNTDIKLSLNDFPTANMADIHLGVFAQRKKIPIIVLKHRKNWVRPIENTTANSIFQRYVRDEKKIKEMTDIINSISEWKLH